MAGSDQAAFRLALLASDDPPGSRAFYADLFGWEAPAGELPTELLLGGKLVAALDLLPAQLSEHGIPSQWRSFVSVDDLGAATERARDLGGTVLGEPVEIRTWGRAQPIFDPQGSPFALWEARALEGAERVDGLGCTCWRELHANDVGVARDFYTGLFGWEAEEAQRAGVDYVTFRGGDGGDVGGLQQKRPEWGDAPPTWLTYFRVDSCDATAGRIGALGARIVGGPLEHPRGRFAVAHDPQDAVFGILEATE